MAGMIPPARHGTPAPTTAFIPPIRSAMLPPMRALLCLLVACGLSGTGSAADDPQAVFSEAVKLFFEARPAESCAAFDRLVALRPESEPELWQRGLALYYAENPAWHFLCVARLEGVDAARRAMLPVGEDPRVPMQEILELFAGRGDEKAVLAAAEQGPEEERRNQRCYAHLYLGLHAEARGDAEAARRHITAAAGPHRMDHYMGRVAVVHAILRGWQPPEPAATPGPDRPGG